MFARIVLMAGLTLLPATAAAADSGGVSAPENPVDAAAVGGSAYGATVPRPVARLHVAGRRLSVRIRGAAGASSVERAVVTRAGRVVARVRLGRMRSGRSVSVTLPRLAPGRYVVRLAGASGRVGFVVRAPVVAPAPAAAGVFPVAGPHSYGDPFGAPRKGYSHQGQDVAGARGTPIVAPLGGTIVAADYQAAAAGEYVVLDASDGHAYFFAHCMRHSTSVTAGQTVAAGARLCLLGQSGDATGPHLHFEEWVGGWRVGNASRPVDPLPQLRAWDR